MIEYWMSMSFPPPHPWFDWFPQREILQSSAYRLKSASCVLEAVWRLVVAGSRFGRLTFEDVAFCTCFQFSPFPLLSPVSRISKSMDSRIQKESIRFHQSGEWCSPGYTGCAWGSWTLYIISAPYVASQEILRFFALLPTSHPQAGVVLIMSSQWPG